MRGPRPESETQGVKRGGRTALAVAMFGLAVLAVGERMWRRLDMPSDPSVAEAAMVDFRDAVYYPVVAALAGENPYDRARVVARYPIRGTIGLYSPLTLLLHLPWGLLPYRAAELAFVVWSLALVLVLAAVAWRIAGRAPDAALVFGLGAVLVLARPGHWNLFLGQVGLETALATLAALWWRRTRPLLAGLGLAVTTFKATYALPLVVLMAARRDGAALGRGIALAAVLTLPPLALVLAHGGVGGFVAALFANYEARVTTPEMSAAVSTFRVDVVALVGRLLGQAPDVATTLALGAAVLAVAATALRRLDARADPAARRAGLAVALLAILLCTYHQQYDLVILAPLLATAWPLGPLRRARLPVACAAVPFVNYLASGGWQRATGVGDAAVLAASSLDIVALLAAFALLVGEAWRGVPR